jgi:hypothetical protein
VRSDAGESPGRPKRASQVVARWLSCESASRRLDVSAKTVARYEAAGFFGVGNSLVLPGGDLRIRARALNGFAEKLAERRELDRQANIVRGQKARVKAESKAAARFERPVMAEVNCA